MLCFTLNTATHEDNLKHKSIPALLSLLVAENAAQHGESFSPKRCYET